MTDVLILIHSPLVGPATWSPVADVLRRNGVRARVPDLRTQNRTPEVPHWKQHAQAVAEAVRSIRPEQQPVLVAHSGAGVLLPAIRQALGRSVGGYIFVDAIIPEDGKSRLDLFDSPDEAEQFRRAAVDGLLPVWTEADLREAIPDPARRRMFVRELSPVPLAVYEEPIPVFAGWPDAPCAFIRWSSPYVSMANKARKAGWIVEETDRGHFHMLVDPDEVAATLLRLADRLTAKKTG